MNMHEDKRCKCHTINIIKYKIIPGKFIRKKIYKIHVKGNNPFIFLKVKFFKQS